jgi:orotate phosphoribosyltransferase-like protein
MTRVQELIFSLVRISVSGGHDKERVMIHKIKALHDNGYGSSIHSIAEELGVTRNTVHKYLRLDEAAIMEVQENRQSF